MIFIGNDIVEIDRIKNIIKKFDNHFLNKIFSKTEIKSVIQRKNKVIHLSGKFSSKEAVKKALCSAGLGSKIFPRDIEILNKENGEPFVRIINLNTNNYKQISLSISHTSKYATSFALIEI